MASRAHILVVDDEPDIRELVQEILADEGYEVSVAENGEEARAARQTRRPDLVLLDIWMPDVDGITLLKEWQSQENTRSPVIMMSGHGTVETAVEATRLGAYDFLEKPLSLAKLLVTVKNALEIDKLQRENVGLKQQAEAEIEPQGKSPTMQALRQQLERIGQHDTPVLITGESGTGKHVAARYLHRFSNRRDAPFVEVGVASIARKNPEVELFGEEQNGRVHYGRLEQANGGTLFLHDIADMDPEAQAKLVSALAAKSFLRVDGSEPVAVDVRIVAATSSNLEEAVQAGKFREDLYYHLNVVPVQIPPLRDHSEDVIELLNYHVDLFVNRDGLAYRTFSVASQNRLRNYSWPGNIRELKNLVQRLMIVGNEGPIEVEEVDAALGKVTEITGDSVPEAILDMPLKQAREEFEKLYLEHQLKEAGGSVGELAKIAGVERTHLYRKLRSLGIDVKKAGKE